MGESKTYLEWLVEKIEETESEYHASSTRSEAPRKTDKALGRLQAYKAARDKYLRQTEHRLAAAEPAQQPRKGGETDG